ncbi:MAG: metallophosphoesterase [Acidobacteriota bacterium]|nr:metallophosphoesterase [Acidobacteriota bacterium]
MLSVPFGVFLRRTRASLAVLLLASAVLFSSARTADKPPQVLIAIGDIHGDFDDFSLLLQRVGLADAAGHWSGGKTTLIQTGDLIDRGPKGRQVMDLLMSLEKEAATADGEVRILLGNHEVMNILGDVRYVPAEDYTSFADNESENRRKAAFKEYAAWLADHKALLAPIKEPKFSASEEEWTAKHPLGFVEYREAMSLQGKYGNWLRKHAAVAQIGDTIFLHGGIDPDLASLKLDGMNSRVREEIEEFDKTKDALVKRKLVLPFFTIQELAIAVQAQLFADGQAAASVVEEYHAKLLGLRGFSAWLCMRDNGPLWFRGYDEWSDEDGAARIEKILSAYGAKHIVVAHTVQKTRHIRARFAEKIFLIDTGMLSAYWKGGRASALKLRDGVNFSAEYMDEPEVRFGEKTPTSSGKEN